MEERGGANLYCHTKNDPTNLLDPDGRAPIPPPPTYPPGAEPPPGGPQLSASYSATSSLTGYATREVVTVGVRVTSSSQLA